MDIKKKTPTKNNTPKKENNTPKKENNTTPKKDKVVNSAKKPNKNYGAAKSVDKDNKLVTTPTTTTNTSTTPPPATKETTPNKKTTKRKDMEKESTTEAPKNKQTETTKATTTTTTTSTSTKPTNKKQKVNNNKKEEKKEKVSREKETKIVENSNNNNNDNSENVNVVSSIFGGSNVSGLSIFEALKKQSESKDDAVNQEVMDSFATSNAFEAPKEEQEPEVKEQIDSLLQAKPQLNSVGKPMISEEEREIRKKKDLEIRESEDPMTIFISNIDLKTTKNELKAFFGRFGTIKTARFRSLPVSKEGANRKATYINKEFHEKRETCNAYVVYSKEEEAQKAADETNGTLFKERHIRVDLASNKHNKGKDENTVFVGGIPYELENEDLFKLFEDNIGDVMSVRIVRDKLTGLGKGFAYVEFKKLINARRAIQAKQLSIGERTIRVFPNKQNPKGKNVKSAKEKKKIGDRVPRNRKGNKKNKKSEETSTSD
ncbi:hypothetical protein PPL_12393 [Heterostelium album PN500]|uniref:RRM domain-containing protein n=1 Tax=Heterostelium pallidum (strain ATCC 26659 / Pp 5 / PN500) TaxID=670386 RepID=D3BMH3_HETP5|nr:hypothetical protein PPL_12393 [Heterostelium album PN500]EFA77185.1 hypothetical protein PPL_12393 [Heterostelium album PN500]|eukprot:XP_020429314.1 hypothetical protein PPL_12393 [Heterostelium album PN500]